MVPRPRYGGRQLVFAPGRAEPLPYRARACAHAYTMVCAASVRVSNALELIAQLAEISWLVIKTVLLR